ncbi:hypothetical protein TrVGV298_004325 [Trichoderma virens]|nr:hypothetical protein TrVGV298_004325 [Trichoderma virens]
MQKNAERNNKMSMNPLKSSRHDLPSRAGIAADYWVAIELAPSSVRSRLVHDRAPNSATHVFASSQRRWPNDSRTEYDDSLRLLVCHEVLAYEQQQEYECRYRAMQQRRTDDGHQSLSLRSAVS